MRYNLRLLTKKTAASVAITGDSHICKTAYPARKNSSGPLDMNARQQPDRVRVIGIDPGTRICGYGVVDHTPGVMKAVTYGVIRAQEKKSLSDRLHIIHSGLTEIFALYKPDTAAVEGAFHGVNARTAIKIGEGRGVALLAGAAAGVEVMEYSPRTVKKSVTGTGAAHKSQVQQMVKLHLGLPDLPEPDDAADALALAICHCHRLNSGCL